MKLNLVYSIRFQKSMLSDPTEVDAVDSIEAEEIVEVAVEEELNQILLLQTPTDILGPSILTFQQETGLGVVCILNTDDLHTFVQNLQPALGRTSTLPNLLKIEVLTSLETHQ